MNARIVALLVRHLNTQKQGIAHIYVIVFEWILLMGVKYNGLERFGQKILPGKVVLCMHS